MTNSDIDTLYFIYDNRPTLFGIALLTARLYDDMPYAVDVLVVTGAGSVRTYLVPGDTPIPEPYSLIEAHKVRRLVYVNDIVVGHEPPSLQKSQGNRYGTPL